MQNWVRCFCYPWIEAARPHFPFRASLHRRCLFSGERHCARRCHTRCALARTRFRAHAQHPRRAARSLFQRSLRHRCIDQRGDGRARLQHLLPVLQHRCSRRRRPNDGRPRLNPNAIPSHRHRNAPHPHLHHHRCYRYAITLLVACHPIPTPPLLAFILLVHTYTYTSLLPRCEERERFSGRRRAKERQERERERERERHHERNRPTARGVIPRLDVELCM